MGPKVFLAASLVGSRRLTYGVLGLFDRLLPAPRRSVTVLCYHSIADDGWYHGVSQETFERQIESLRSEGVRFLSIRELSEGLRADSLPDGRFVVLTFDDGYRDILAVKDFLRERDIFPTLFVLSDTAHVDMSELATSRDFLKREEILELAESGWDIGCHSATHRDFWQLDGHAVRREVFEAKRELEQELGLEIRYFAYPRGRYTSRALESLEEAGFELGFSMDDGLLSVGSQRFRLPRIGVNRTHSLSEFHQMITIPAVLFRKLVKDTVKALSTKRRQGD